MKVKSYYTHALFECLECGKHFGDDHWKARKKAYQHARNTGHKVYGETGTSYHYN